MLELCLADKPQTFLPHLSSFRILKYFGVGSIGICELNAALLEKNTFELNGNSLMCNRFIDE
jgi:hypothetical protein